MEQTKRRINPWVIVAAVAFGYCVDLYDLLLFGSVRAISLKELGIEGEAASNYTLTLMSTTVTGMLIGGFLWGILADKKGRLTVLFASIITYTIANFANAFIQDIESYFVCRFISGIGLAGELGIGLTLTSEVLSKKQRSNGATVISSIGLLGAVAAGALSYSLMDKQVWGMSSWRFLYLLGGILGVLVLFFRLTTIESEAFKNIKNSKTKGSLKLLFSDREKIIKFLCCFAVGAPIFIIVGILVALAPEFGKMDGIDGIETSLAILYCYGAIFIADIIGTQLSRAFKTRKKIILLFLIIETIGIAVYLFVPAANQTQFYIKISLLGLGIGHWGTIVINSVEQFGTNLRATVTTAVPNIVRFLLWPFSALIFTPLKSEIGLLNASIITVSIALVIAFVAIRYLKDNFEKEVDYEEQ